MSYGSRHAGGMMMRKQPSWAGKQYPVINIFGGYRLPAELPEGSIVKLLSFDHGYWTVDHQGRQFTLFMACIDTGWQAIHQR